MKILALLLSLATINAFAYGYKKNTTNFTITSLVNDGSRIFYSCDSVEYQVVAMLKDLGAKNIRVRCSGGFNPWGGMATEAYVRASFDALSSTVDGNLSTAITNEKFRERKNCHLNNAIFKGVKKNFEIINSNSRTCFRASDRTIIDVEVVKEEN